jgi:hypothetical protein
LPSITGTGFVHATSSSIDAVAVHGSVAGQVPITNSGVTDAIFGFIFGPWATGGSGTGGTFTNANSPVTATAAGVLVPCDTSGGIVQVNTPAGPTDGQIFGVKPVVASATPITVHASSGTIEDPSNAGTFGANGSVPGTGGAVLWKYRAADTKWIGMSGF